MMAMSPHETGATSPPNPLSYEERGSLSATGAIPSGNASLLSSQERGVY